MDKKNKNLTSSPERNVRAQEEEIPARVEMVTGTAYNSYLEQ